MRSIPQVLRRSYAAIPAHPAAAVAQKDSLPLRVRERRAAAKKAESDLSQSGNGEPAKLEDRIQEYKHRQSATQAWRGRIRGSKWLETQNGKWVEVISGQRIYLPNIIIRMMRNHTPPGKPYNPFEATFRIPQMFTKTDFRGYLSAVYGVNCTYIRTDNYMSKQVKDRRTGKTHKSKSAYKRAVVGLVEPFYYPLAVEDMNGKERFDREAWLEENFRSEGQKRAISAQLHKMYLRHSTTEFNPWHKDDRHPFGRFDSRATILRNVMKRREERETRTQLAVEALSKFRKKQVEVKEE